MHLAEHKNYNKLLSTKTQYTPIFVQASKGCGCSKPAELFFTYLTRHTGLAQK